MRRRAAGGVRRDGRWLPYGAHVRARTRAAATACPDPHLPPIMPTTPPPAAASAWPAVQPQMFTHTSANILSRQEQNPLHRIVPTTPPPPASPAWPACRNRAPLRARPQPPFHIGSQEPQNPSRPRSLPGPHPASQQHSAHTAPIPPSLSRRVRNPPVRPRTHHVPARCLARISCRSSAKSSSALPRATRSSPRSDSRRRTVDTASFWQDDRMKAGGARKAFEEGH